MAAGTDIMGMQRKETYSSRIQLTVLPLIPIGDADQERAAAKYMLAVMLQAGRMKSEHEGLECFGFNRFLVLLYGSYCTLETCFVSISGLHVPLKDR